jgi:hypothetical protein
MTRQSINLRKDFLARKMDARVNGVPADPVGGVTRPAHDWQAKSAPTAKPGAEH